MAVVFAGKGLLAVWGVVLGWTGPTAREMLAPERVTQVGYALKMAEVTIP